MRPETDAILANGIDTWDSEKMDSPEVLSMSPYFSRDIDIDHSFLDAAKSDLSHSLLAQLCGSKGAP